MAITIVTSGAAASSNQVNLGTAGDGTDLAARIAALINGSTDIAESSRPMKQEEKDQVRQKGGKEVAEIPVAQDGLAIYVNKANAMKKITLAQAKAVYTGKFDVRKGLAVIG